MKNNSKAKRMNKAAKRAIKNWLDIGKYMEDEKQDNTKSYVNCMYHLGRMYSKIKSKTNQELRVGSLD